MKWSNLFYVGIYSCVPLILFSIGVLLSPYIMKQKPPINLFETKDFEIWTNEIIPNDSQDQTIESQNRTLEKLEKIHDYVQWTKDYFDKTITKRVAGLVIRKLRRKPEVTIGTIYKASIIVVYMEDQDGEFMKHGEIEFEEGTPSSLGMMWERIP